MAYKRSWTEELVMRSIHDGLGGINGRVMMPIQLSLNCEAYKAYTCPSIFLAAGALKA